MRVALMFLLALAVSACQTVSARRTDSAPANLPFYESADFTPHWTRTSDHQVGDFSLRTQSGRPLTRQDLLGRHDRMLRPLTGPSGPL